MYQAEPMSELSPATRRFVLHWGEMGIKWGINRSVAQIHALLYVSAAPVSADRIGETLGLARSNVSTSLKELQNWGIVKTVHLPGDRRDHFQTLSDPWELFRKIASERKKRELDPTLDVVQSCLAEMRGSKKRDTYEERQLSELLEFLESSFSAIEQIQALPVPALRKLARLGKKLHGLLG